MKKRMISAAAALLLICTAVCSCGSFSDPGIEAVAKAIEGTVGGYTKTESPIELPDGVEYAAFIRESAEIVPDVITVYRAETAEEAEKIVSLCNDYLDILCDPGYITYVSAYDLTSAAKLQSAEVFRVESYVVLCISDAATVKNVKKAVNGALHG